MKRFILAIAIALTATLIGASSHASNLQDFSIAKFDINYELSRDEDGRSRLKTTETITADFPDRDQNHGIERVIPKKYDGHSTSLKIESVKKADGKEWEYDTESENGNLILRIGDADKYVHGLQTFVITYTQRDVTRAFSDTKSDEFYWDTNGTDWKVPVEILNVSLTIDDALKKQLTGKTGCYQGASGSNAKCQLSQTDNDFTVSATGLNAGENVTVAVGFKPKTFAAYEQSFAEKLLAVWFALVVITGIAAVAIIIFLIIRWDAWSERRKEKGTIVPEYIPPADASIAMAATVASSTKSIFTAQLLDLAVRHYIRIIQTREKSFLKAAEYDIEIIKDISTLKAEEREVLKDIFGGSTAVGQKLALKTLKNNTSVQTRMLDNEKKLKDLVQGEYGVRARDESKSRWFKKAGLILLIVGLILLSPPLLVAALVAYISGYTLWPLTDKGLALSRYMDGLKMYIKVAEQERLRMLQSPEGAAKVGIDANDSNQLVKLYERVLPYAALFGQEKEWAKRIGDIYESSNTSPSWFAGNNAAFNAVVFSSAMSGFNTAASYTSASSSSSGGSSGGGSSGGGGGGGGGGGW